MKGVQLCSSLTRDQPAPYFTHKHVFRSVAEQSVVMLLLPSIGLVEGTQIMGMAFHNDRNREEQAV